MSDRITERYKGETSSEEGQAMARQRIHWMCCRVEGQKVIDIGCSQGIVPILLAREGFEVVGVDIDDRTIEYANSDRAEEPPEVQQRLTFIRGDIYNVDLPDREFNTAIMGEFLEHLVRPDKAITRAYELLVDDGKLIITVPFGLMKDPDHKQTFYIASLHKLIYPYFMISEVEIIGRWLCLLCKRREAILAKEIDSIDLALVEREEREIQLREVALTREAERFKAELHTTKARLARETTRLRTELTKEQRTLQAVRASLSFQLGSMLIQAVRKPGRNTVLLPYRVFRLGIRALRKKPLSKPLVKAAKKAYVLEIIRGRIDGIKQQIGSAATHAVEPRRKDLKIAVIMDDIFYELFKYEANLIAFTPDNWKQVLSEDRPDFLLVESAWHGNDASWRSQIINLGEKPLSQLPELVQWCKTQNIPTIFWNKEDPAHYEEFLDAARLFDFVYTTDSDCIERYKKALGHNNIFCLPLAVQPRIHNPIGSGEKIRDVAFAGSWYAGESEDKKLRREQMANILAPALQYDVDIYDRNFSLNNDRYRFPEQYQPYIVGELPYDEMVYAYKMYNIFLNVSSVSDSPTFLPRRVFEILASGTCVLSGYCKGIDNMLGPDIVPMNSSPEETRLCLEELLGNKELKDRLAHLGLRKVMKEHTYEKRLDYILKAMGLNQKGGDGESRGVSIITSTNKLEYMDNIFANYDRQQYEHKELIIVLNNNLLDIDKWSEEARKHPSVTVYRVDEKEGLGTCLNFAVDKARFEYIAKFDDDDYYASAYLEDLMIAFDYSGADIVGKCAHYVYFEKDNTLAIRFPDREHCFTKKVTGGTMVIKRSVFKKVRFDSKKGLGSDTRFQQECLQKGLRIYSADRFNLAGIRRLSPTTHTWQASDDEILLAGQIVCYTKDYVTHVTC